MESSISQQSPGFYSLDGHHFHGNELDTKIPKEPCGVMKAVGVTEVTPKLIPLMVDVMLMKLHSTLKDKQEEITSTKKNSDVRIAAMMGDEQKGNRGAREVQQVFQEFADGTSMHGVPRIINARSIHARFFWSVICMGAFGMFLWQCGILLERYYSYPKKVI